MQLTRTAVALALGTLALNTLASAPTATAQVYVRPSGTPIGIEVGKGLLINLQRDADTVFVADPTVADVQVKSPKLIYLYGKEPGNTSLYAVDAQQTVLLSRPVSVKRDVTELQSALHQLAPDGNVRVSSVNKSLVLSGNVGSSVAAEEARHLASTFVGDENQLVNHVTVSSPYQVNLRVRIAEVTRTVTKELGINWETMLRSGGFAFGLATGNPVLGAASSSTSGQITNPFVPGVTNTGIYPNSTNPAYFTRNAGAGGTSTDSIILGNNSPGANVNSVIDALDQNGLVNILAEPSLTAMSGETASFLAGGEFPIIIPGGSLGQTTVEFKQYGVSLAFTPVVLNGGRISLRVRPEVSQLTNTGAVEISGINIPALTTRRTETTVELASGQSFAIGGLLQNNLSDTVNKLPGLGDLPILGPLFRSTQFQRNESELVIIVTPYLVQPSDQRIATPLDGFQAPHDVDLYLNGQTSHTPPPGAVRPVSATAATTPTAPRGLIGPAGYTLN
ncbi:MAG TPA: type II and III secretion system protein family protein [Alphaproteobacteria bacterium]|nr:type II and III secretion system protein family protein [Alphaproteobacteria bacterium]